MRIALAKTIGETLEQTTHRHPNTSWGLVFRVCFLESTCLLRRCFGCLRIHLLYNLISYFQKKWLVWPTNKWNSQNLDKQGTKEVLTTHHHTVFLLESDKVKSVTLRHKCDSHVVGELYQFLHIVGTCLHVKNILYIYDYLFIYIICIYIKNVLWNNQWGYQTLWVSSTTNHFLWQHCINKTLVFIQYVIVWVVPCPVTVTTRTIIFLVGHLWNLHLPLLGGGGGHTQVTVFGGVLWYGSLSTKLDLHLFLIFKLTNTYYSRMSQEVSKWLVSGL